MRARLAFAIATAIVPEILLLDEGIGAGDAAFIEKANRRLNEFVGGTGILVLASHSQMLVRQFCNKYLWLEHGKVALAGEGLDALDGILSTPCPFENGKHAL
jgi:ABC-type polysaccharide/polyol phosphate transport system ATPase subunit